LGKPLEIKSGTKVQNIQLDHTLKQAMDGGSRHQAWRTVKPNLPTVPHPPRVDCAYVDAMFIFEACLEGAQRMDQGYIATTALEWISTFQMMVE
jgi:hypothetical protein